jgi:hypothetical protein
MNYNYSSYIENVTEDITTCIDEMGCQPILFIGSGLSKRYFGSCNWEELLKLLAQNCPTIDKEFAYYKQINNDPIEIGSVFAKCYNDWAWGSGRAEFPQSLFSSELPPEIYIKYKIAEYFKSVTPEAIDLISDATSKYEIECLRKIQPHAVITTNYDCFLEKVFPEYEPIIGQKILRVNHASIGEIFKIHGCISDPQSIVLTKSDYNDFLIKKKYLSAKLLAYFAEHPLLFIGYKAEDPNIKNILSDIDEIISSKNELIPNIYILEWKSEVSEKEYPVRERVISIDGSKSIRVKSITASSFDWVFKAFGSNDVIEKVNTKLLRALLARTYELVRHDIPKKNIQIDYSSLEHTLNTNEELAKILGITTINNPTSFNATYPYTLTKVSKQIGDTNWHTAHFYIEKIRREKGVDIKASDNRYHIAVKTGETSISISHKYSDAMIELLLKVKTNSDYEINL